MVSCLQIHCQILNGFNLYAAAKDRRSGISVTIKSHIVSVVFCFPNDERMNGMNVGKLTLFYSYLIFSGRKAKPINCHASSREGDDDDDDDGLASYLVFNSKN